MNSSFVSVPKSRQIFREVSQLYQGFTPSPFLVLTQDFFNNYDATGKPNWNCLMSAVRVFDSTYAGDLIDPFYEFLFDLLNELKCQESFVLQFSLHCYYRNKLTGYGFQVFDKEANLDRRNKPCRKNILVPFPDFTIKYENIFTDIYPFILHDYQAYRHFVRYGMNINLSKAERFYYMMDIVSILNGHYAINLMETDEWNKNVHALMHLMSKFPSNEFWNRRVALAMLIVDSLIQLYHVYSKESLYSMQLFFRTITDAYLTLDEMTGIMEILLERQDDREKVVQEYCETYKTFFPKAVQPVQPRSLKHLCRVQVRQCMIVSNSLHFGVSHLHVPETLKNYLLLQE